MEIVEWRKKKIPSKPNWILVFFWFFFNGTATDRFSEMRSGVAISSLFFLQVTEFFSPSKREREKSDEPTAKEENKKKTG